MTNKSDTLAFDRMGSARWIDDDGRLHVDRSNFTRVQVAPYRGDEVPGWQERGLERDKVYYAYRPASELSDPETVRSIVGIPIQLRHNLDYPDAPAKKTRVGSTGDTALFEAPFLSNSLHIHDQKAIDLIQSGEMRELSLCYSYEPDFQQGKTDDGVAYDFTMRKIRGQHIALVEEGRAGATCCVADSAERVKDSLNPPDSTGVSKTPTEAKHSNEEEKSMDDKDLLEELKQKGLSSEVFELVEKELAAGQVRDEEVEDEEELSNVHEEEEHEAVERSEEEEDAEELSEDEEQEGDAEDADEAEDDEEAVAEAEGDVEAKEEKSLESYFKKLGVEVSPEMAVGLAAALHYVQKANEEKKLEEADEDEGKAVAEDSADKLRKEIEKEVSKKAEAIEECRQVLGRVKFSAFDSAGDVYLSALKQMGKDVRGVSKANAQVVFNALQAEGARRRREVAEDSARAPKHDALSDLISKVKVSI